MRITARQKIKHYCKDSGWRLYEGMERQETQYGTRYRKTVRIETGDGNKILENRYTYDNLWVVYRELAKKYLNDGVKERRVV